MDSSTGQRFRATKAFTLVELLVVIAIVGILVSLLLPAVQSARAAARRIQCANNLRNCAQGWLNHESAHRQYPGAGWGPWWVGDADAGFGKMQPGGWVYRILPFVEEQNVWELGAGLTGTEKFRAHGLRYGIRTAVFNCPSRRSGLVPLNNSIHGISFNVQFPASGQRATQRSDYASNLGNNQNPLELLSHGPWLPGEREPSGGTPSPSAPLDPANHSASEYEWPDWEKRHPFNQNYLVRLWDGVSFNGSELGPKDILDGTSKTYMLGEKHVDPLAYEGEVRDYGDDWGIYTGQQDDIVRTTKAPPQRDTPGGGLQQPEVDIFGSAHPEGLHMVMCDASVHFIGYDINAATHMALGGRRDGKVAGIGDLGP